MYRRNITIKDLDDAKSIVNIANKYKNLEIKLSNGDYVIDAHSIMGVISMGVLKSEFSGTIALNVEGDIPESFNEDIKSFVVNESL